MHIISEMKIQMPARVNYCCRSPLAHISPVNVNSLPALIYLNASHLCQEMSEWHSVFRVKGEDGEKVHILKKI